MRLAGVVGATLGFLGLSYVVLGFGLAFCLAALWALPRLGRSREVFAFAPFLALVSTAVLVWSGGARWPA